MITRLPQVEVLPSAEPKNLSGLNVGETLLTGLFVEPPKPAELFKITQSQQRYAYSEISPLPKLQFEQNCSLGTSTQICTANKGKRLIVLNKTRCPVSTFLNSFYFVLVHISDLLWHAV